MAAMTGNAIYAVFPILPVGHALDIGMAALATQFDMRTLDVFIDLDMDQAFLAWRWRFLETQAPVAHDAFPVVAGHHGLFGKNRLRDKKQAGKEHKKVEQQPPDDGFTANSTDLPTPWPGVSKRFH
jgi:hypothetical protein